MNCHAVELHERIFTDGATKPQGREGLILDMHTLRHLQTTIASNPETNEEERGEEMGNLGREAAEKRDRSDLT